MFLTGLRGLLASRFRQYEGLVFYGEVDHIHRQKRLNRWELLAAIFAADRLYTSLPFAWPVGMPCGRKVTGTEAADA